MSSGKNIGERIYRNNLDKATLLDIVPAGHDLQDHTKHEPRFDKEICEFDPNYRGSAVMDWLEENSLDKSDITGGYLFMGSNHTLCSITTSVVYSEEHPRQWLLHHHRGDSFSYFWKIYLNYQPQNADIPQELDSSLRQLGFVPESEYKEPIE